MIMQLIEINPNKLGGEPVFKGTRIPIALLFDYLEAGSTVEEFIDSYEIDPDLVRRFMRALRGTLVPEILRSLPSAEGGRHLTVYSRS